MISNYDSTAIQSSQIDGQATTREQIEAKDPARDNVPDENTQPERTAEDYGITGVKNIAKYIAFAEWIALPQPERRKKGIESANEFGRQYGINPATLWRWKQREDFWKRVESYRNKELRMYTSTAMHALLRRVLKYGMWQDVEGFLAYVEGWHMKQVIEHTEQPLTADDLRNIIKTMPEDKQQQFYDAFADLLTEADAQERLTGDQNDTSE